MPWPSRCTSERARHVIVSASDRVIERGLAPTVEGGRVHAVHQQILHDLLPALGGSEMQGSAAVVIRCCGVGPLRREAAQSVEIAFRRRPAKVYDAVTLPLRRLAAGVLLAMSATDQVVVVVEIELLHETLAEVHAGRVPGSAV
jgi:hypothetical protein